MVQWLVIGIGNEFRGDDAIGCVVARKLPGIVPEHVRIIEHQGDGTSLLCLFSETEHIILIDAVRSGRSPGFIHRLDLLTDTIPNNFIVQSSHQFGVIEAVALSRELHQLPSRLILYGVEAAHFEMGKPLSPEVEGSVSNAVDRIIDEISGYRDDRMKGNIGHHSIEGEE